MKHKVEIIIPGLPKEAGATQLAGVKAVGEKEKASKLWHMAFGVVLGALLAPYLKQIGKPVARGAVKVGIRAGRGVQSLTASVKEDLQDLAAEARHEIDSEEPPPPTAR